MRGRAIARTSGLSTDVVWRFALAVATALALLVLGLVPAANARVARGARADSTRSVHRIEIGQRGVIIDGDTESDPDVDIDLGGVVHVRSRGDTQKVVRIRGPVVVVDDQAGLVRLFADAEVPADKRIDGDVVAVFGSVHVVGQVSGDAVAVFGSVALDSGAVVEGDAVAVGGGLDQDPNAIVNGESVSLGFFNLRPGMPAIQMLLVVIFCGWLLSMLLAWLLLLLFPERMMRIAETAARRTGGSFLLGLVSKPLFVIALVLLLITVVGIPFALLLPIAYLLALWAGQIAATYVLGCRLMRRPLGSGGGLLPVLAGTLFVSAFFALGAVLAGPEGMSRTLALFFTLLGALLVLGLSIVGVGAVLLSRFGSRPRAEAPLSAPAGAPGPGAIPPPATVS